MLFSTPLGLSALTLVIAPFFFLVLYPTPLGLSTVHSGSLTRPIALTVWIADLCNDSVPYHVCNGYCSVDSTVKISEQKMCRSQMREGSAARDKKPPEGVEANKRGNQNDAGAEG